VLLIPPRRIKLEVCTALPYNALMLRFIELPSFTKYVKDYFSDDEYRTLQIALVAEPRKGVVIPHSGGVRKMRWAGKGKGTQGGYRIIYYYHQLNGDIWFISIYAKSDQENIEPSLLKKIKGGIDDTYDPQKSIK